MESSPVLNSQCSSSLTMQSLQVSQPSINCKLLLTNNRPSPAITQSSSLISKLSSPIICHPSPPITQPSPPTKSFLVTQPSLPNPSSSSLLRSLLVFLFFSIVFCFSPSPLSLPGAAADMRAINLLFKKFKGDPRVRPVIHYNETITVTVSLVLQHIFDLDEKHQLLESTFCYEFTWNNGLMTWNPDDFDGISKVNMPVVDMWRPDVVLLNTAGQMLNFQQKGDFYANVNRSGFVYWAPSITTKSICEVEITYFPFDEQKCSLQFSTWMHDESEIDLHLKHDFVETYAFVTNTGWDVFKTTAVRKTEKYPCCEIPYSQLYYHIYMRRKPVLQIFQIVMPCILLYALTLTSFWLPQDSAGKASLATTIFLASCVQLLVVADYTPPSASSVPIIGIYYAMNSILSALAVMSSVLVLHTKYQGTTKRPVPYWLTTVLRHLCPSDLQDAQLGSAKDVRMHFLNSNRTYGVDSNSNSPIHHHKPAVAAAAAGLLIPTQLHSPLQQNHHQLQQHQMQQQQQYSSPILGNMDRRIEKIEDLMKKKVEEEQDHSEKQKAEEALRQEWRLIAQLIDRFCFILYICVLTLSPFLISISN